MGLNTIFALLAGLPTADALFISTLIFKPASVFPQEAWGAGGIVQLINTTDFAMDFLTFIGAVVPVIVALIIASFLAENPKEAFAVLTFTLLLSSGIYALLLGIGQGTSAFIYILLWLDDFILYGGLGAVLMVFIGGIVNCFFYGAIAMYITKAGL